MRLPFVLAWRYLNGRKLRTFLTTLAVVFGVLVIFGMNIILPTMMAAFQANVMAASGAVDVSVIRKANGSFPAATVDKLRDLDGIRSASVALTRTINLPADFVDHNAALADRITAVTLVGVDPQTAQSVRIYLIQPGGRFLHPGDSQAAVIAQSLADAYGVRLGGTIAFPSVNGNVPLTVVGLLPTRTSPGNEEVLVTLPEAQALTGQPGQINTIDITLNTADPARRNEIVSGIAAALGSEYQVGALEAGSELIAALRLGQAAFNLFGLLALFMGGFIIFNTFRTVVAERRRDIGMLRALGASRRTIVGMILIEGLLQGGLGSVVGLLLGYLLGAGIVRLSAIPFSSFIHLQIGAPVVSPTLVLVSILLGVGITLLSGLVPALNASRVTPLDALRPSQVEVELRRSRWTALTAGLVLLVLALLALFSRNLAWIDVGCFLLLIGLILLAPALLGPITSAFGRLINPAYARQGIGELAQNNLNRQPGRVVITASATMIGMAIIVGLGGMTSSIGGMVTHVAHTSLGSDYIFVPPSISVWSGDLGASPDFAAQLEAIPGVDAVTTLRYAGGTVNGIQVSFLGLDPLTYPRVAGLDFSQGGPAAYAALGAGRAMIVNGAFLSSTGTTAGETVAVQTSNGSQDYRIVAVGTDLLNAKVTTAFVSQASLAQDFGVHEDVFLQLNLKPGVKLATVDPQIRQAAGRFPQFTVITAKSYIDQMLKLLNAAFTGLYILLAFLTLPSLIAMLNTMAISVIERRREIGVLRAVGATRSQVRRLVTAEALLLAAVGTAFGILAGLYLGTVIVGALSTLFPLGYAFPLAGILAAIATGLIFGALAAYIPARQAARLQVVEALRYE